MNEILEKLQSVIYPGFKKSIVEFGFVKQTEPKIILEIPSSNPQIANTIKSDIEKLNLNKEIEIITPNLQNTQEKPKKQNIAPQIKNFVMVSSGKGGVGKSTTTLNLAISMAKLGKKVGLLDADIYGPNIPRMLGEQNTKPQIIGQKLSPILTHGIEMVSMGVLVEAGQSLIWRGAMIMGAIKQLLSDVDWSDLDVLFIDMPPGTGDAQLTIAQSIPITLGICVTTPQIVALDDTKRSLDMFEKLHIPIGGIIENMSGFVCDKCDKYHDIFGSNINDEFLNQYSTKILAKIPIEPSIRLGGDDGKPISFYAPNSISAKKYETTAYEIWEQIEKINASGGVDNSQIQPES